MFLVFQHITTEWTKQSRGMPNAAKRNAVPKYFPIPPLPAKGHNLYHHRILSTEAGQFRPEQNGSWHDIFNSMRHEQQKDRQDTPLCQNWFFVNDDKVDLHIPIYDYYAPHRGYTNYDIPRHFPGKTIISPTKLPFNTIMPQQNDEKLPIKIACLTAGQTLQFEINEKQSFVYAFNGGWTYFQHVMNFHFTDKLIPDIFQTRPFDKITDMKTHLL